MVHGFTSAGLIASQYETFCRGANLGFLNEHYISSDKHTEYIRDYRDKGN